MTINNDTEYRSGDNDVWVNTHQKNLIYVFCHDCDEVDEMQIIDAPQESDQVQELTKDYTSIMEMHADQTGHFVQLGTTKGSEIDLVDIARALSSEFSRRDG